MPLASSTVTVRVVVLEPSAVTVVGTAVRLEFAALGGPATNVTEAFSVIDPMVAVTVFASATVDLSVAVNTPDALVVPLAGANVFDDPVLDKLTN